MTKKIKQKVQLELHGHTLRYGRLGKDGNVQWAKTDWKIGRDSYLPKTIFFGFLAGYVLRSTKGVERKSFATVKDRIIGGLFDAALALGCTVKFRRSFGDVTWYLDGKRFFAFQIHDVHRHRLDKLPVLQNLLRKRRGEFRKMEQKSYALLRGAVVVLKGGCVRIVPGKARKKKSE